MGKRVLFSGIKLLSLFFLIPHFLGSKSILLSTGMTEGAFREPRAQAHRQSHAVQTGKGCSAEACGPYRPGQTGLPLGHEATKDQSTSASKEVLNFEVVREQLARCAIMGKWEIQGGKNFQAAPPLLPCIVTSSVENNTDF